MTTFTIDPRFCGPDESGNGGYTCGLIAGHIGVDVEVTLRYPPPLGVPLEVRRDGDRVTVGRGDILVAEAQQAQWDLDVPPAPTLTEAEAAVPGYPGFVTHEFPRCFVCGIDRNPGDGLRLFTGPVEGRTDGVVAASWQPDDSLPADRGVIDEAVVWAALDCPGSWAEHRATENQAPVVLGRMAARILRPVASGSTYIAGGWPTGRDGRKLYSGTALWSADGELHGYARQTWIVVRR